MYVNMYTSACMHACVCVCMCMCVCVCVCVVSHLPVWCGIGYPAFSWWRSGSGGRGRRRGSPLRQHMSSTAWVLVVRVVVRGVGEEV